MTTPDHIFTDLNLKVVTKLDVIGTAEQEHDVRSVDVVDAVLFARAVAEGAVY